MIVRKPQQIEEPESTCHYQPRDTRMPVVDEVVDVAR